MEVNLYRDLVQSYDTLLMSAHVFEVHTTYPHVPVIHIMYIYTATWWWCCYCRRLPKLLRALCFTGTFNECLSIFLPTNKKNTYKFCCRNFAASRVYTCECLHTGKNCDFYPPFAVNLV